MLESIEEVRTINTILGIVCFIAIVFAIAMFISRNKERTRFYKSRKESYNVSSKLESLGFSSFVELMEKEKFTNVKPITVKTTLINPFYQVDLISGVTTITVLNKNKGKLYIPKCLEIFDSIHGTSYTKEYYEQMMSVNKWEVSEVSKFTNSPNSTKTVYHSEIKGMVKLDTDKVKDTNSTLSKDPVLYIEVYTSRLNTDIFFEQVSNNDLIDANDIIPSIQNFLKVKLDLLIKTIKNEKNFNIKRIANTNMYIVSYRRNGSYDFSKLLLKIK